MASLRARLVDLILPLLGSKARLASAEGLKQSLATHTPQPVGPSTHTHLQFKVTERMTAGMHVYKVAPKIGAGSASVLYLHGGAFVHELTRWHWRLIESLVKRTGATVHVPSYPLAPSNTWALAGSMLR